MKICIISDTHSKHEKIILEDNIDLIIHCGDFTGSIKKNELESHLFLEWFSSLEIDNKILIAGNHDLYFEEATKDDTLQNILKQFYPEINYLYDESIIINNIKFHGSPWTPIFLDWAFMKDDSLLEKYIDKIPLDTEILITHGPAFGILDKTNTNLNVGSKTLLNKIIKLKKLKYHLFGHIHENNGIFDNSFYKSINASIVDYKHKEIRKPYYINIM